MGFIAIASDLIERSVLQELQPWLMELNQTPRPGCKEAEGGSKESTEFMSLAAAFLDESPSAAKGNIMLGTQGNAAVFG